MTKQIYNNIDLSKSFELQNFRIHNVTTLERTSLGTTLGILNKGLIVFDTNLSEIYFWDGVAWVSTSTIPPHAIVQDYTNSFLLGGM